MATPHGLRVTTRSGSVRVEAEDRDDVVTDSGRAKLKHEASIVSIDAGSDSVNVRCPIGCDVVVGSLSGSVELVGRLGQVRVTAKSGSIHVDEVSSADLRTLSGSVHVERCAGECRIKLMSGSAHVGEAGAVQIASKSGKVEVGTLTGGGDIHVVSGGVEVEEAGRGDLFVKSLSGSVRVGVAPGIRPSARLKSLSGKPLVSVETGNDCVIAVSTLSGRIELTEA
jgi:DUF4097 and DUF4098 domain-containing protein YvlB